MPITYRFDHLHILSRDPKATARYYQKMFDAKAIETLQADGKPIRTMRAPASRWLISAAPKMSGLN